MLYKEYKHTRAHAVTFRPNSLTVSTFFIIIVYSLRSCQASINE